MLHDTQPESVRFFPTTKVYEERQLCLKTCHGRDDIVPTTGFPCCRMFSVDTVFAQTVLRRSARRSHQVAMRNVLRALLLNLKSATFQPELRECATHTTFELESCDFAAGAAGTCFGYYLYLQVPTLQPGLRGRTSRATSAFKSHNIAPGAAGTYFAHYFCTQKMRLCSRSCRTHFAYYADP